MKQPIVGFHQDQHKVWVAQLVCKHVQHVRHEPPLVSRQWVLSEDGREAMLGFELECKKCDDGAEPDLNSEMIASIFRTEWDLAAAALEDFHSPIRFLALHERGLAARSEIVTIVASFLLDCPTALPQTVSRLEQSRFASGAEIALRVRELVAAEKSDDRHGEYRSRQIK